MAKKNTSILDPKAKAAKQKKQAAVLGVVFLALLAFSVPKTMKMMKSTPPPQAAPAPATTTTPATGAPVTPSAPATGVAQPASATSGVDGLVVNADLAPAPLEGQLALMTTFEAKDPFRQQELPPESTEPSGGVDVAPTSGGKTAGGETDTQTDKDGITTTPGSGGGGDSGTKAPVAAPTAATLSVNGVEEVVNVKNDFPAASPLFHLVALTAKTAKISVAGGSLATGAPTVTLKLGKPLTLMNTADGTRYVVILVNTNPEAAAPTTPAPAAPAAPTQTP
jgi:hypothetical protein